MSDSDLLPLDVVFAAGLREGVAEAVSSGDLDLMVAELGALRAIVEALQETLSVFAEDAPPEPFVDALGTTTTTSAVRASIARMIAIVEELIGEILRTVSSD